MLRNRTPASVLQKIYDESYLTCSTAVYYESQGNEREAMRCWKSALEQIYDHHANKTTPNYIPRSETEKALVESLRQLELQCKERIDLLEALRLSREDGALPSSAEVSSASASASGSAQAKPSDSPRPKNRPEKGWIGNGTIPAITYTELSKPANIELSRRKAPSNPGLSKGAGSPLPSSSPSASPKQLFAPPPYPPPSEAASSRPSSPERHTMRTTLRSEKPGEKPPKRDSHRSRAKPPEPPGASEAATLAWASMGRPAQPGEPSAPSPPPASRSAPTLPRKQWDSHTRRLVSREQSLRTAPPAERRGSDLARGKSMRDQDPDESAYLPPSQISVSAASTALAALSRDVGASLRSSLERAHVERKKTVPSAASTPGKRLDTDILSPSDQSEREARRRKSPTGNDSVRRKAVGGATLSATSKDSTPSAKTPRSSKLSSGLVTKPRRRSRGGEADADNSHSSEESSRLESADEEDARPEDAWKKRKVEVLRRLPAGVDESAAKQILNEIVVQGDEVHWDDVAGLGPAKSALREAVVYPFLRPDLFKGLREPARGMLLFGPPGTGKTMLARAVATESRSTFFSISASSLTSKYLGESEKLVRALFALAKVLAPSIIFFDEIDSLLSQRSTGGEHEASRRIKTEFFIQWSALQRAAAGRDPSDASSSPSGPEDHSSNNNNNTIIVNHNRNSGGTTTNDRATKGDPNRVLVLAATNLPWAIDEAARRRFVRRQYIPLPEAATRATQLRTLLRQQKHTLSEADMAMLVGLTDGFSGSDVTALAKDAAMGPLRALGEALLSTRTDEIRPIGLADFIASLASIRPSVSKSSLKEYEDWAEEFGERAG